MRLQNMCPLRNASSFCKKVKLQPLTADLICAAFLFVINLLWFLPFMNSGIIMGDDIGVYVGKDLSFMDALTLGGAKYRPVYTVAYVLTAKLFGSNYQLYFLLNMVLFGLISLLLYDVLKKITGNRRFLSLVFSVIFLISPFSYYNVLQLIGLMETLCLLQLVLIFRVTLEYWRGNKKAFWLALLLLLTLSLTHERYVVMAPWLLIVVLCVKGERLLSRILKALVSLLPLLINVFLKEVVFQANFLEGTGGTAISIDVKSIIRFFIQGLLGIFGINNGPDYLFGYTYSFYPTWLKVITVFVVLTSFALLFTYIVQRVFLKKDKKIIVHELKVLFIAAAAIGALLISGCTTIRLEARWINAPLIAYLIYFAYIVSKIRIPAGKTATNGIMLVLLILIGIPNYYQHQQTGRIYFSRAMYIGRNVYETTVEKYGESLADYHLYFITNNEMQWAIGSQNLSMFQVYLDEYVSFEYANSVGEIRETYQSLEDKIPVKIFKLEPDLTVSEVDTQTLTMELASDLMDYSYRISPDSPANTPSGKGVCFLTDTGFTVLSGYTDTIENVVFPKNAILYFNCSMPFDNGDGAQVSVRLVQEGFPVEMVSFSIQPGGEAKTVVLPMENIADFVGDIEFIVTSPSGDDIADWVTFSDAGIFLEN